MDENFDKQNMLDGNRKLLVVILSILTGFASCWLFPVEAARVFTDFLWYVILVYVLGQGGVDSIAILKGVKK